MRAGQGQATDTPAVAIGGAAMAAPWLVVCEHASADIPAGFGDLGLSPEARLSHIAWDPGALGVARHLAAALGAPLVAACQSRLIHDLNRPPAAPEAMPEISEIHPVPGNRGLTARDRAARAAALHVPFHDAVARLIAAAPALPVLVTVHSFTPVYRGRVRQVELGVLHDSDSRLADAMLAQARDGRLADMAVARNAPYGPGDGVTYTLQRHALPQGLPNVMLELRNDLIATAQDQQRVASALAPVLLNALAAVGQPAVTAQQEGQDG